MTASPIPPPFPGFLLVVGGQARKVGKSALVVDTISAFPKRNWTAVKITPYTESGCPINGRDCGCAADQHSFAIREEDDRSGSTDTSRFLGAGAQGALWVQTKEGRLPEALSAIAEHLRNTGAVIIESDAIVRYWKPSLFLMVLDPANPDFKRSARENLSAADAFVLRSPLDSRSGASPAFEPRETWAQKPRFNQEIGAPLPAELWQFLTGSIS
jgi:hypothetical protein